MAENPPAFPLAVPGDCQMQPEFGMSLRDWFAGQALVEVASLILVTKPSTYTVVARLAYELADAMLAERERQHALSA